MNIITTKEVIKTFAISVLVFYIPYVVMVGFGYVFHGENTNLNFSFSEFIGIAVAFILPGSLLYGLFYTLILSAFSLLDKRVFNKWFVAGFAFYCFIGAFFIIKDLFYFIGFILISLMVAIAAMNIRKWIKT